MTGNRVAADALPPADETLRVELELTGRAIEKARSSAIAMVFGQAIVATITAVYCSALLAGGILIVAVVAGVWRQILHRQWPQMSTTPAGCRRARRRFLAMTALLAANNVVSVALVYPAVPPQAAAMVLIVLLASLTVAALFLTLVRSALLIWLLPPLLVTMVVSLVQADGYGYALAAVAPIYGLVTLRAAREQLAEATAQVLQRIELERTAGALDLARRQAEAAGHAKSRFLATMSHELRTPMNGLIGTLDLLADSPLSSSQLPLLRTARRSSDALLEVINDILDFASIDAGHLVLRRSEFSPATVAQSVVGLFSAAAARKGVHLRLAVAPDLPPRVLGDPTQTRQVLLKLFGNALKFTEHGEVALAVSRAADDANADKITLVFTISDTGIGIPPERQATLFQAFAPGDQSTTRQHGGTGIGLALVKQLVDAMEGTIAWQSSTAADCRGSVFTVRLPYSLAAPTRSPATPDESAVDADLRSRAPVDGPQAGLAPARRLLLVDENAVNRLISREMLSSLGLSVVEAEDAKQALAALATGAFDVVLIDCQFPLDAGLTTCRQLRARARELAQPQAAVLLAVSANTITDEHDARLASDVDGCVSKPINLRALATTIERALGKRLATER